MLSRNTRLHLLLVSRVQTSFQLPPLAGTRDTGGGIGRRPRGARSPQKRKPQRVRSAASRESGDALAHEFRRLWIPGSNFGHAALAVSALALCFAACSGEDANVSNLNGGDASETDATVLDSSIDTFQDGSDLDSGTDTTTDASTDSFTDANTGIDASEDVGIDGSGDATSDGSNDAALLPPFQVFVNPAGSDANDGSTPSKAVLTLGRVHELLVAASPDQDVEVRIAQGSYMGQSVTWTYYHPVHSISFMPIDYQGGGIGSIAGRPVFDGQGAGALLTLNVAHGRATNLSFLYLQIQGYRTYGLLFRGNRNDFDGGWNGGNRVYGCLLRRIGNLANSGDPGYGALDLVNSRANEIRNNHFVDVENASNSAGLMHAVYLAHGSSENQIRANRFSGISGDPIRVRDGSNHNQTIDNVFEEAGSVAFISDWWCDMSTNPNCTKPSGECPSWENAFRDNELHCGYSGKSIATFTYFQGESYVPSWCVNHGTTDGWARIRTSGNTKSCP